MLKQLKLILIYEDKYNLSQNEYRVNLYHDGILVSSEEYINNAELDELLEQYQKEGYEECYTYEEVSLAKQIYMTRSKYVIGGPKEWEFVKQDDNDMPIYKCPICGRKQFGKSTYCGDCGDRLIWDGSNAAAGHEAG